MPDSPALRLASMTGFGRAEGVTNGLGWVWEVRSVNGRGLDLRLRLPPGLDALEPALREAVGRALRRGNVSATLTLRREAAARHAADPAALDAVLALALPGVLRTDTAETAPDPVAVQAGFATALAGLVAARLEEGGRLALILSTLLDEITALHRTAGAQAADQPAQHQVRLAEQVAALVAALPALPAERIAQEVALLAARSDVREELDRLAAHNEAARALLAEGTGVGRKLDFLVQEFNREANTLCSKSASLALTATGLALKAAIERLREQVANVE